MSKPWCKTKKTNRGRVNLLLLISWLCSILLVLVIRSFVYFLSFFFHETSDLQAPIASHDSVHFFSEQWPDLTLRFNRTGTMVLRYLFLSAIYYAFMYITKVIIFS